LLALAQCVGVQPPPNSIQGSSGSGELESGNSDGRSMDSGRPDSGSASASNPMSGPANETSADEVSTSIATSGSLTDGLADATDSADDVAVATGDSGGGEGVIPFVLDCNAEMPTTGAQLQSGNGTGGQANLAWEIWSNTGRGELTTYNVPAFTASWNEAGGYLGRLGYEWGGFGGNPVPHEQLGTITAHFASRRTGTAGTYSYIGMYGWSTDPCVEWYIVDDSFNYMPGSANNRPINPGNTNLVDQVDLDDGTYLIYTRPTTGTGGTRCAGATQWIQYYSVRTTPRVCGQISLTEHFEAWESLGMDLGNLLEAKILVEVGGGTGRVDLPVANVTVTP